jgi:DNA-binding LacI/PurR family transcriptional regulator
MKDQRVSRATIKDVAQAAGVSTATVSYVINGTGAVTDTTRARVLAAAARLGYRASATARGLQAQRTRLIGYSWRPLPPRNASPILDRFIHSMGLAAYRAGYHLLAFPTPSEQDELVVYQDLVATHRVDGIVLSGINLRDPRVDYLSTTSIPFVSFGRTHDDRRCCWVDIDGRAGVRLAVEHLASQGHSQIAMLAWPAGSQSGQERYQGYLDGLEVAGLPARPEWVVRVAHQVSEGYRGMVELLHLHADQRPTAVVCVSDLVAMGAINAVSDVGLRVGPDIAIVGFDDMPVAESLRPPLSTLHQAVDEVGNLVIRQLVDLIEGKDEPAVGAHILLEPPLIIRESSLRQPGKQRQTGIKANNRAHTGGIP